MLKARLGSAALFVIAALVIMAFTALSGKSIAADYVFKTVVLSGDEAPGTDGLVFTRFGGPAAALNDKGQVATVGFLNIANNNIGIWKYDEQLSLVVRTGDTVPGIIGATFGGLRSPNINLSGELAFFAALQGVPFGTERSLWLEDRRLNLIVRDGDLAPGTGGETYTELLLRSSPAMNNLGDVAFDAKFSGPPIVPGFLNVGSWKATPDKKSSELSVIAITGDPAPNTGGEIFKSVGAVLLNDSGNSTISGFLSGSSLTNSGIWRESPSLELVVRKGDSPAEPLGSMFGNIFQFAFNSLNNIAFFGGLRVGIGGVSGSDNSGIWKENAGLKLVVRENDPAPGTIGAVFDSFGLFSSAGNPGLNDRDDVAILARLRDGDTTFLNQLGIWAQSPSKRLKDSNADSDLQLVIRQGDVIEVRPGDFRTVSSLETGFWPKGFNNCGEFALNVGFSGPPFTSGILIATLHPEDLIEELIDGVLLLALPNGVRTSLLDKLTTALSRITDGNPNNNVAAAGKMRDFVALVENRRGNDIPELEADALIDVGNQTTCLLRD